MWQNLLMTTQQIIAHYYDAWISNDRDKARSLLADDLKFRSPSDNFDGADEFFDCCWKYAADFNEMPMVHEVYGEDRAYIAYRIGDMVNGEFIRTRDGRISEIHVTFNVTA